LACPQSDLYDAQAVAGGVIGYDGATSHRLGRLLTSQISASKSTLVRTVSLAAGLDTKA
jgi:hypothetical protein